MSRAPLALLLLAFTASPLVGAPTPAPSIASAKAAVSDCTAAAPRPLLKKASYAGYRFAPGPENTATEQAASGTVHLEIASSGCDDGIEHSFVFIDDRPLASYDDRDHWLLFAAEQLKALKTYRRGQEDVNDLLDFLSGAKIATTRKNDTELRLEVCRDGTPPPDEDGCPLKTGGGYRFAVRALDKNRIQVYVSRYLAPRLARAPKGPLGLLPRPR